MANVNISTRYGDKHEIKLLNLIIGTKKENEDGIKRDYAFGKSIIRILRESHFSTLPSQKVVKSVLWYYQKYHSIPYYDELKSIIVSSKLNKEEKQEMVSFLKEIESIRVGEERRYVMDSSEDFFKRQRLKEAQRLNEEIIDSGDENYGECLKNLREAMKDNDQDDAYVVVGEVTEEDMQAKPKEYVKLGWGEGLESYFNGGKGLEKGGVYAIFAPSGAGKTTGSIVSLSNAYLAGKTVVQVFFEGSHDDIKKMQRAHWSGLKKSAIKADNSKIVIHHSNAKIQEAKSKGGVWIIKKFRANHTKFSEIESFIEELIEQGYEIDMLSLDYLECVEPSKKYHTDYGGELEIMRDFEFICEHHNICGIVFFQGNRSGQNARLLTTTHLGGNFKKIQPAWVLMTVATPINDRTNIAIIDKNRLGQSNVVFTNCLYDRGNVRVNAAVENYYGSVAEYEAQFEQN